MRTSGVSFSIARHAAWAPALTTPQAWNEWANAAEAAGAAADIGQGAEPALRAMPPMLRRRAGFLGKMALEVAYECLAGAGGVPSVFCSRHGDVGRAVDLLGDLAQGNPLSPTAFGTAVHNASAGLFSIARADRANHIALAAGHSTVEHAVIEACGLLADGAPEVLLVSSDCPLPTPFGGFQDCAEQPHAWAWLMVPAGAAALSLHWQADGADGRADGRTDSRGDSRGDVPANRIALPASLDIWRFYLGGKERFERVANRRRWSWTRHA
ncbi:MAG TPA: beta-ketoacyl synthase chain length factor [Janthinobacterium sp.]|nr:beta-ketoacyl synthase chain length factor [Janthinobacterium sp.]